MKKFYEAIIKVRNSGIDMTSGEMIMREMKALVGDSCNLECRWLKCALKRNMQMEFVGSSDRTLNEKNEIVKKVRTQLTLEEKLNDIAVDVTVIALMLLGNWKEDYYSDFDISYIDTAGSTDSKLTFESKNLKTEEENSSNKKVNADGNAKYSEKRIFNIEEKKKSFSNRASRPLEATVDVTEESDGGKIKKIAISIGGVIVCIALVLLIVNVISGRDKKTTSNENSSISKEENLINSENMERTKKSDDFTDSSTEPSIQSDSVDLVSLNKESSTDGIKEVQNIMDTKGNWHATGLCGNKNNSVGEQYCIYNIEGKYSNLTAVGIVGDNYRHATGKASYKIYGDGKLLWENNNVTSKMEPQLIDVPLTEVSKLKIEMYGQVTPDRSGIDSILCDIKLHKDKGE